MKWLTKILQENWWDIVKGVATVLCTIAIFLWTTSANLEKNKAQDALEKQKTQMQLDNRLSKIEQVMAEQVNATKQMSETLLTFRENATVLKEHEKRLTKIEDVLESHFREDRDRDKLVEKHETLINTLLLRSSSNSVSNTINNRTP